MGISVTVDVTPSISAKVDVCTVIREGDGGDCPSLCEMIGDATAEEIVGCLSEEQEGDVQGLICDIPSGYCYRGLTCMNDQSYRTGDAFDNFTKGNFNVTPIANPAVVPMIDGSIDVPTMLVDDNKWGNKYRFTDLDGDPADGVGTWGHTNWKDHTYPSGKEWLVKDHYTGAIIAVIPVTDGSDKDLSDKTWEQWIDYVDGLSSFLGISDLKWCVIPIDSRLPHFAKCTRAASGVAGTPWAANFFNTDRSDTRVQMLTGETFAGASTNYLPLIDSNNDALISGATTFSTAKAGGSGFGFTLTGVYVIAMDKDDDY